MRYGRWGSAVLAVALACTAPSVPQRVERASPAPAPQASERGPTPTRSAPQLSVAGSRSCLLQTSGALWCWGDGVYPDTPYWAQPTRVEVPPLVSVSVGAGEHQCGITSARLIVCWGAAYGPRWQEIALPSGVRPRATVTGPFHACAISEAGEVYCWGKREPNGILSDSGSGLDVARIPGVPVAEQVVLGYGHACAVSHGQMQCWGEPRAIGAISATPARDVRLLAVYSEDTLALSADGSTHSWGSGHLALPSFLPSTLPIGLGIGIGFACALKGERVECWGKDDYGQTSSPSWDITSPPATVPNLIAPVELGVGAAHACARERGGAVKCWGAVGALGIGTQPRDLVSDRPVKVLLPDGFHAAALDAQKKQACALDQQGRVACWGDRADTGARSPAPAPQIATGFARASAIQLGDSSTCARIGDDFSCRTRDSAHYGLRNWPLVERVKAATQFAESGARACAIVARRLHCWGDNFGGTLGVGRPEVFVRSPRPVLGLEAEVLEVSGVHGISCALTRSGRVYCWGSLAPGSGPELSNQQRTQTTSHPIPVIGLGPVAHLRGACFLDREGQVACLYEQTHAAKPISLPSRALLLDDSWGGCALLEDNSVWCWDAFGTPPRRLEGLPGVPSALAVGENFACALLAGEVYCWGGGEMGQLGTGRGGPGRIIPQSVELP